MEAEVTDLIARVEKWQGQRKRYMFWGITAVTIVLILMIWTVTLPDWMQQIGPWNFIQFFGISSVLIFLGDRSRKNEAALLAALKQRVESGSS